ncbi:MAG: septum formation initiator family protein [Parcubacteria group bacterium]|nr:septum formation initiator family protein [Parcubacteria group bacterium]
MPNSIAKTIFFSKPMIALEVCAVLAFGFYVGKEVVEKRAIEAQIAAMEADIAKLVHEKDSLGELIRYAETDSFIQQEAREKLNLTAPGESVVVIPDIDSASSPTGAQEASGQSQRSAILGAADAVIWWEYFFDHDQLTPQSDAQYPQ